MKSSCLRLFLVALAGMLMLAVSCENGPDAALKSVTVEESDVMVPVNGSADILFRVDEADYAFDLEKDVVLYLGKGSFHISTPLLISQPPKSHTPPLVKLPSWLT